MNLKDKKVILTGSSSGIGLELLSLLYEKGATILAVDQIENDSKLPLVFYIKEDISTQKAVDNIFEIANKVLGGVDIFIANAGFAYYEEAKESDWNKAKEIFNLNVYSPIYAFHKLKKAKKDKPFQFVVTASAMSYMPLPGYSLYSGTKHALKGFFEGARNELPKNQIISLIYPIATRTPFYKDDTRIPSPNQSPKTVAKHYLKGIEKNKKNIFPSKSFWIVRHLSFLMPLVQKLEGYHFKVWKKKRK